MLKILMHGVNGRMGQVIVNMAANNNAEIVAGVDVVHKPCVFPVFSEIEECDMDADVVIDFSTANAIPSLLNYVAQKKIPAVICTTGLSDETIETVKKISETVPIFMSANMSLGINLLVNLCKKAADVLYDSGFDIEIIEKHHNQKIDAPSGTALLFANAINATLGNKLNYQYDRSQKREKRTKEEIGIHSLRGGAIVGEHSVFFAGTDEVIEFKHSAASKETFAVGAYKAAKYIVTKDPGIYNMDDLIDEI